MYEVTASGLGGGGGGSGSTALDSKMKILNRKFDLSSTWSKIKQHSLMIMIF
jgi:hypothetical protein